MRSIGLLTTLLIGISAGSIAATAQAVQPDWPDGAYGAQVLTRGPVHEAFAETVMFEPGAGVVVRSAPPNPIEEVPPTQRPEGASVTWIAGYNAWDDERDDYVWVSGVWRNPPPGRQWVSGYWGQNSAGYQWTPGYWGDAEMTELEYLPEPPQMMEVGPGMPAPSPDHSWIPGTWIWYQGRYAWRPGYWITVQPDWNWIPAHYAWTPRGYVFIDGYWDYPVQRRGVLFAPVYFDANTYAREGFYYSPSIVISLSVFADHLFVRPQYHHYYFGDYYDSRYEDAGYYSRTAFQSARYGYDPIYAHQRWEHRQDRDWDVRVDADYRHRREHVEARPPRTLLAQAIVNATGLTFDQDSRALAVPLDRYVKTTEVPTRFQPVASPERDDLVQRSKDIRKFRSARLALERQTDERGASEPARIAAPVRVPIPRSPIAAKRLDDAAKDRIPPRQQKAPDPDPRVEPKPRKARAAESAANSQPRQDPKPDEKAKGKSKQKPKKD